MSGAAHGAHRVPSLFPTTVVGSLPGFQRELAGKGRDGKYWHTFTGEVKPGDPAVLADHARFAIERATRPIKVALPSPYMLSLRMWDEGVSRAVYPTREAFADAIVPILRAQVIALAQAGSYDALMPALRVLAVDQLMMEFTIPVAGDTRCLRELPDAVGIGLGCVDCRGEVIDEPETIVARVEHAMEHVDKRRITLAPDCGFAPGNASDIPVDEAYAKLHNMVRAAAILRAKHG